ncbi:MAG: DUF4982 domain-containing protein [Eubacterium sp.]|nr:DUF4982 domain-containing protein [Eubacterium sp.]MCM1218661.1 DUF4982 domain-containing protein [Lachnospiraceae bacterium]MCM1239173.1 DUF4982 domain-containing protein [Lachnospiraceae bacterium]
MERKEQRLMTGWEFAFIPREPVTVEVGMAEKNEVLDLPEGLVFQVVDLPHDWAVGRPFSREMEEGASQGFRDRWGVGWYRKTLTLADKKEDHIYTLVFGAVYENCTVWVNGQLAGRHRYGYSTFRLDVTALFKEGENSVVVRVDNTILPVDRWYSGCGIYRTVKLVETGQKHLDLWDVTVETAFEDGKAIVQVDAGISGCVRGSMNPVAENLREYDRQDFREAEAAYRVESSDRGQNPGEAEMVCRAESRNGKLIFTVNAPLMWSAEKPYLYRLSLELMEDGTVVDRVEQRIGLRRVEMVPGRGMFVNGASVKLHGVCLHQECGGLGNAVRPEIWRERLLLLKKMGCNAIRAAHHTFAEEFLDLCDEMGFYVYEECFDKWKGGLYGRYFEECWKQDLEAMVKRDRNRPSIVIWGVGNEVENQGQESMLSILKMLYDYVKALDGTRPVTYAMNPHFKRESDVDLSKVRDIQQFVDEVSDTEICDPEERVERIGRIGEIVDIISCNYQEQWYDLIHEKMPQKLILGTECYQYFCGHYDQMQNFSRRIPALEAEERDYCIGGMIWTGYDYLGESMGYPAKGWSGAMIRTNNEVRPLYYLYKSLWIREPVIHFSVMDYSLADEGCKEHWDTPIYADHWHFPQFGRTVIPYMIMTNCEEVVLELNGKRFYLPRPLEMPDGVITGFLPWQPGTVKATGYIDGKEVCSHVMETPGPAVGLEFDRESVQGQPVEGYQMLLTVRAVDAEGKPCFRENGKVRFRVEGDGKILAVDNGDITGGESCKEEFIHLYHGCASVVIALGGKGERVSVWADAAGMRSGRCLVVCGDIM